MARIRPEDWRPHGIPDLEPEAWRALRHVGSSSVVAGPGAGKTEFLAQKAVYLLETDLCRYSRRILAISFKTDAAKNLGDRVRSRCPPELAARFVSLTFDAFTKGLVDRFRDAIPSAWRPTRSYDIASIGRREVQDFLETARLNAPQRWQAEIAAFVPGVFESQHIGTYRLPRERLAPRSASASLFDQWWRLQLRDRGKSTLTFVSINRLAELILRTNPQILRALRATYPFVFVDEFQDTTYAQYDFLLSAFFGSSTAVTAVGDDKQRIMVWAGARPDAFRRFGADFAARPFALIFNYRSSPDLAHIQYVVARALDDHVLPSIAQTEKQLDGDVAQVWNSPSKAVEVRYLADWIVDDMRRRSRRPRDYALLVRQKADDFEADLVDGFNSVGLRLRNESRALGRTSLQDLLADEICRVAGHVLRLASGRRAPQAWRSVSEIIEALRAASPEDELACRRAELGLIRFLQDLREFLKSVPPTEEVAPALADRVFSFLDHSAIMRTYPAYGSGDLLAIMIEAFKLHLAASAASASTWSECLDAFEGVDRIPLMTVHKSKGLEFDTILFVGLDDDAWWSHTPGSPEGLATFFVALSRAKQRAIFSFCRERGMRRKVAELYQLLTDAGVQEISL